MGFTCRNVRLEVRSFDYREHVGRDSLFVTSRADHRQDAGLDCVRQFWPPFNDQRQIRVDSAVFGTNCAAFCATAGRNPCFSR